MAEKVDPDLARWRGLSRDDLTLCREAGAAGRGRGDVGSAVRCTVRVEGLLGPPFGVPDGPSFRHKLAIGSFRQAKRCASRAGHAAESCVGYEKLYRGGSLRSRSALAMVLRSSEFRQLSCVVCNVSIRF